MLWSNGAYRGLAFVRVLAAATLVAGCRDAEPRSAGAASDELRVVSISPAISRTLVDLGLEEAVIGRTPFCAALAPGIPVVGDQKHIDYETLVRLDPSHVLVQESVAGVDAHLRELADRSGWRLGHWRLDDIDDIRRLVDELPPLLDASGPATGRIRRRADELLQRLDETLEPAAADLHGYTGRTLLVCGLEPVTVFGEGTYLH
ncbi:MAG: substrate-binding domain-containing protein [Planctomycetota bacterium]|jgi:hypothetical protein